MITIDFTLALGLCISFILILVFGYWIFYTYDVSDLIHPIGHFHRCHFCTFIFFTHENKGLYTCPRCKSYIMLNESSDKDSTESV